MIRPFLFVFLFCFALFLFFVFLFFLFFFFCFCFVVVVVVYKRPGFVFDDSLTMEHHVMALCRDINSISLIFQAFNNLLIIKFVHAMK